MNNELYHHGILGQKWGIRRYQNPDGTLTEEGRKRYGRKDVQKKFAEKIKNRYRSTASIGSFGNITQVQLAANDVKNLAKERRNVQNKYIENSRSVLKYFNGNKDRLNECGELAYEDFVKDYPELKPDKKQFIQDFIDYGGMMNFPEYSLLYTASRNYSDNLNNGMIGRYKAARKKLDDVNNKISKACQRYADEFLGQYGNDKVRDAKYYPNIRDTVSLAIEVEANRLAINSTNSK